MKKIEKAHKHLLLNKLPFIHVQIVQQERKNINNKYKNH